MNKVVRLLATWFHLGLITKAPGTWGTLGALPLVVGLAALGPMAYLGGTVLFTVAAVFVAHFYEKTSEGHDASEIVIDEVAGYLIAMAWLPLTWQSVLYSFVLFRLLDIFKPPPIGWVDQKIRGGLGVVADDVLAGVIANVILQIVFVKTAWLGYQLVQ